MGKTRVCRRKIGIRLANFQCLGKWADRADSRQRTRWNVLHESNLTTCGSCAKNSLVVADIAVSRSVHRAPGITAFRRFNRCVSVFGHSGPWCVVQYSGGTFCLLTAHRCGRVLHQAGRAMLRTKLDGLESDGK